MDFGLNDHPQEERVVTVTNDESRDLDDRTERNLEICTIMKGRRGLFHLRYIQEYEDDHDGPTRLEMLGPCEGKHKGAKKSLSVPKWL